MYQKQLFNKNFSCYFCQGSHLCRDCPIEKKKAKYMKKEVGKYMESYYAENFKCIRCGCENLSVLNNRTPSLDIVCEQCNNRLEIKSKCLSINKLPKDIMLLHGSFEHYKKRQNNGLDFAIIIYGINRVTKEIIIREIMYFLNEVINTEIIKIVPNKKSQLSKIIIPDRENSNILKLNIPDNNIIDFKNKVQNIVI